MYITYRNSQNLCNTRTYTTPRERKHNGAKTYISPTETARTYVTPEPTLHVKKGGITVPKHTQHLEKQDIAGLKPMQHLQKPIRSALT